MLGIVAPAGAYAQEAHPRRAFARYLRSPDVPVVLLAEDRAWMPQADPGPAIALCNASGSCRPIVERGTCEALGCPGAGHWLRTAGPIADVDEYPDDLD